MARKFVPNIELEGLKNNEIFFRNFAGEERLPYNNKGDRNFAVVIPDGDLAQELLDAGWNVRLSRPRDPQDEPRYFLTVKVKYTHRPPKIVVMTRRNQIQYDEDMIAELDDADIKSADIIINPSFYEGRDGEEHIAAYLKTMYVTLEEDRFAAKYAREEYPEE